MKELNDEIEIWKPVVDYEGLYEVSNKGRLIRFAHYSSRSINQASLQTGIPRKSIEAVVNEKKFFHKDGSHYIMQEARDFKWKKVELNINQYKELL